MWKMHFKIIYEYSILLDGFKNIGILSEFSVAFLSLYLLAVNFQVI